jgi:hypothetical protein
MVTVRVTPSAPDFILGDKRAMKANIYDGACGWQWFWFSNTTWRSFSAAWLAERPGSRFVVETAMAAESFLPDFEEQTCHQVGDITLTTKGDTTRPGMHLASTSRSGTADRVAPGKAVVTPRRLTDARRAD